MLPCTTLSQRAVPATLPFDPVVCYIPGGRTVFSFQGASVAMQITPPYINPTTRVQKTTKFFVNSFSSLYEVLTCAPDISTSIAMPLTVHWVIFLRIVRCFCADSYLFRNSPIQPEKQKSAAQNRTKTTNCPNSVSYGAWKIFSPYGSCSACTIRNRFALFGFQSVSTASRFRQYDYTVNLAEKARTIFPT